MCTLSWRFRSHGYEIFFNRDEQRSRKPALPPAVRKRGRTRFLAPEDGDCGGTWVAASEHGLTYCLLNGFPAGADEVARTESFTSRGLLPLTLVDSPTLEAAEASLRRTSLEPFRPFVLVAFAPEGDGLIGRWSGRSLDLRMELPADQPLVSSSFLTEEVRRNRADVFRELMRRSGSDGTELHLEYHRAHEPRAGAYSPCMHREDAETVSFCWIAVGPTEVRFRYVSTSPCRDAPGRAIRLTRQRAEPTQ